MGGDLLDLIFQDLRKTVFEAIARAQAVIGLENRRLLQLLRGTP